MNPEYFNSVGTQVLIGRGINAHDTATSPHVAVVNEDFVKALFRPGENPIGRSFVAEEDSRRLTKLSASSRGRHIPMCAGTGSAPCTLAR